MLTHVAERLPEPSTILASFREPFSHPFRNHARRAELGHVFLHLQEVLALFWLNIIKPGNLGQ